MHTLVLPHVHRHGVKKSSTHQRISQTRAGRVDKNVKFNIRQKHVGDTLETRYMRVLYAWCTLIYVDKSRCALQARLDPKIVFQTCLKFSRSSGCPGRVSYTFRISWRFEYALNAFGARFRHATF